MSAHEPPDLGARLLALAPPMDLPVDLIEGVRRRARRRLGIRMSGASAAVAAVVAGVLVVSHLVVGPAAPGDAELHSLVATGDAPPIRYTGPGIPVDLKDKTLWLVAARDTQGWHRVLVTYAKDGHPCLGDFDWRPDDSGALGSSNDGSCSYGNSLPDLIWSYGPNGPSFLVGPEALLFGVVPANVRVVRADVHKGRLTEKYVATIGSPVDHNHRIFVFVSPEGTDEPLDAQLTFFAADGTRIGSRHVDHPVDNSPELGCPPAPKPGETCAQATIGVSPAPTATP